MPGPETIVRPFQLPQVSPAILAQSQYNQASQTPIIVTPGFGGSGGSLPPLNTGQAQLNETVTFYMAQAAIEQTGQFADPFAPPIISFP